MRVQVHDEPARAASGSQTVRQSLRRAAFHIYVISSGLLTLLLGSLRLFGEVEIPIVTLNVNEITLPVMYSPLYSQPGCLHIFSREYSTFSIHAGVTLK